MSESLQSGVLLYLWLISIAAVLGGMVMVTRTLTERVRLLDDLIATGSFDKEEGASNLAKIRFWRRYEECAFWVSMILLLLLVVSARQQ